MKKIQCILVFILLGWFNFAFTNPIAITTHKLHESYRKKQIKFLGVIQAKNVAVVQAKTAGVIKKIYHYPGDTVKTGTLLLSLDDTEQKLKLGVAQNLFNKAQTGFAMETNAINRAKILYQNNAISKTAYQEEVANYQSVTSSYHDADSNLQSAKLALSYTQVFSPISGNISEKKVYENTLVNIGTPLFVITPVDNLTAVIPVPENLQNSLKIGMSVTLENMAIEDSKLNAKISGINKSVNQSNHSIVAYVDFKNPGNWYPGNNVIVIFKMDPEKGFQVSQEAISFHDGKPQVFMIQKNHVKAMPVTQIILDSEKVWIQGPLKNGMEIANIGSSNLFNGAEVAIKKQ